MTNGYDHKAFFNASPMPRLIFQVCTHECTVPNAGCFRLVQINEAGRKHFDEVSDFDVGSMVCASHYPPQIQHILQALEACVRQKSSVSMSVPRAFPSEKKVNSFTLTPVTVNDGPVQCIEMLGIPYAGKSPEIERERDDAISLVGSVFDVSEIAIVITDDDRRIVKANNSFLKMCEYNLEELIGYEFTKVIPPHEHDIASRRYQHFIQTAERKSGDMQLFTKNAETIEALFTTATLELSRKRRFQITTLIDITERKAMEARLKEAKTQAVASNRAKSSFLANMSHELRTPLNAIIGFSEMIKGEIFGDIGHQKYKDYLSDIHMSAQHLLGIINEILDMSKVEAGSMPLDEQPLDVMDVIDSVLSMMAPRLLDKELKIHKNFEQVIPIIKGDQRILRQVILNIMTNAVKYSHDEGIVEISGMIKGNGDLSIEIHDYGIGIPEDRIEKALEPFGQIHDNPFEAQLHQGTGLGLPIAKAMVEMHGGTLGLKSGENKGTTVLITLPAARVMNARQIEEERKKATAEDGSMLDFQTDIEALRESKSRKSSQIPA